MKDGIIRLTIGLIIFFIVGLNSGYSNSVLFIELKYSNNKIEVLANLDDEHRTFLIKNSFDILNRANKILAIVNETNEGNPEIVSELNNHIDCLSKKLINPISDLLLKSDILNIKISNTSIRIPFEFLKMSGNYLYLLKPIIFSYDKIGADSQDILKLKLGFIVRDSTADPENACGEIYSKMYNSKFYQADQINIDTLKKKGNYDFLLMSVHGGYDLESTQSIISVNDELVLPKWLPANNLKLAYFDSCELGKGINFLDHFSKSGTKYFIGPIISNESGNSSTKTIVTYFKHLESNAPIDALLKTKRDLKALCKDNSLVELWFAASFRLYKLQQ